MVIHIQLSGPAAVALISALGVIMAAVIAAFATIRAARIQSPPRLPPRPPPVGRRSHRRRRPAEQPRPP
jgi:hypothetical protein